MKPELELLSTIKKAQPNPALYAAIKQRIIKQEQLKQEQQFVPWTFLRAVAAIFVVIFAAQLYFINNDTLSKNEDISLLVSINSNTLYDEY